LKGRQRSRVSGYSGADGEKAAWSRLLLSETGTVDGCLQMSAFACGPDSFISELLQQESARKSAEGSIHDDHSLTNTQEKPAVHTRLEAFLGYCGEVASRVKLTCCASGQYAHSQGEALFEALGIDVVLPPPPTKRTMSLGSLYSPEFACLPLKVNIGNYLEALEKGADTIVMVGGIGPCRLGLYGEIQRQILEGLRCDFKMIGGGAARKGDSTVLSGNCGRLSDLNLSHGTFALCISAGVN